MTNKRHKNNLAQVITLTEVFRPQTRFLGFNNLLLKVHICTV